MRFTVDGKLSNQCKVIRLLIYKKWLNKGKMVFAKYRKTIVLINLDGLLKRILRPANAQKHWAIVSLRCLLSAVLIIYFQDVILGENKKKLLL